jgi:hypothetical protein
MPLLCLWDYPFNDVAVMKGMRIHPLVALHAPGQVLCENHGGYRGYYTVSRHTTSNSAQAVIPWEYSVCRTITVILIVHCKKNWLFMDGAPYRWTKSERCVWNWPVSVLLRHAGVYLHMWQHYVLIMYRTDTYCTSSSEHLYSPFSRYINNDSSQRTSIL